MKKTALFHGTDGTPDDLWWPWLKRELKKLNYEIYAPLLPKNHTPNKDLYEQFVKDSGWDFTDNILIGHSSGATTVLNLLSSEWLPKVGSVILFGTFLNERLVKSAPWYEPGQFDNLFLAKYDPVVLKDKATNFYFIHGDNDPYCGYEDAKDLCNQLCGKLITIINGHHLAASSGIKEFPQVIKVLADDKVL